MKLRGFATTTSSPSIKSQTTLASDQTLIFLNGVSLGMSRVEAERNILKFGFRNTPLRTRNLSGTIIEYELPGLNEFRAGMEIKFDSSMIVIGLAGPIRDLLVKGKTVPDGGLLKYRGIVELLGKPDAQVDNSLEFTRLKLKVYLDDAKKVVGGSQGEITGLTGTY